MDFKTLNVPNSVMLVFHRVLLFHTICQLSFKDAAAETETYYMSNMCGSVFTMEDYAAIFEAWPSGTHGGTHPGGCEVKIQAPSDYRLLAFIDYVRLDFYGHCRNYLKVKSHEDHEYKICQSSGRTVFEQNNVTIITLVTRVRTNSRGLRIIVTAMQEALPSGECPNADNFQCSNNWCIAKELKCNRDNNCGDNSDETWRRAGCSPISTGAAIAIGFISVFTVCLCISLGCFLWRRKRDKPRTYPFTIYRVA